METLSINNIKEDDNVLSFNIKNIDVCIVNALRRTILSKIDIVVFNTSENNDSVHFKENTTILNNEILKQRLGCIPVYLREKQAVLD